MPEIDGLPINEIKVLSAWYRDFGEKLRDQVLKPRGTKDSSREFNQADAAQRLEQVRKLARVLDVRIERTMGRQFTRLARDARSRADRQAIEAGVKPDHDALAGSFSLVNSRALSVVARDTITVLRKATAGAVDKADRVLRATTENGLTQTEINDIIAGRLISGDRGMAIRQLAEQFRQVHDGDVLEIRGRTYNIAKYSETVIRTKTRQASVIARHERLTELGIDLVIITGKLSKYFCTAYVNQIFSISGKDKRYPALSSLPEGGPPFHPNCSKSTRAYVEEFASETENDALAESPDLQGMLNLSPQDAQRQFDRLQLRQQATARTSRLSPVGRAVSAAASLGAVEAQARRLGVERVNLSQAPNTGRRVVNALESAKRAGAEMPRELRIDAEVFGLKPESAADAGGDGVMRINPKHPHWRNPRESVKEMRDSGDIVIDDPNYVVYHELGHVAMRKQNAAGYNALYDDRAFASVEDALKAGSLGRNATVEPLEFVADAYAAKLAGHPLPKDAVDLYLRLGGPR